MTILTALTYIWLWVVGPGAVPSPAGMTVRNPPCGLPGAVAGITYDRALSPTTVFWPDPYFPGLHCAVPVSALLAKYPKGTYHFATTGIGEEGVADFIYHIDPHTTTDFTIGDVPPQPPPTCAMGHTITIRVIDWTKSVGLGGRGKVELTLANSFPITKLQVKLGNQVIGEVTGQDLRDLSGIYFSVPRVVGDYNLLVAATDVTLCATQTTTPRTVTVK